jgi:hypothetical protein
MRVAALDTPIGKMLYPLCHGFFQFDAGLVFTPGEE